MTREEAFKRLEQMYDFYAHAMDANKNYLLKGDAEAIKVALLVMAQARSAHITREQVEKMKEEWVPFRTIGGANGVMCGQCKYREYEHVKYTRFNFCPACGCPMTDKAVDILWKRLEEMQDGNGE